MHSYKDGKWAKQILAMRQSDGLWGNFHTLSRPVPGKNYTTEQAIRRLWFLGFTADDKVIQIVLDRMEQCLRGQRAIDNYSEKKHDWPLFEKLMLVHGCASFSHRIRRLWKSPSNGQKLWKKLFPPAATTGMMTPPPL